MSEHVEDIQSEHSEKGFKRFFKKPGKNLFWAWIAYQAIKGITTTSLIWIPLIYYWWVH